MFEWHQTPGNKNTKLKHSNTMATTVTKKTYADWISEIEGCGDDLSRDELINLVFAEGPNASWSDMVREMQAKYYYSMYNYLKGMFPMRVWEDWSGSTELGKEYHAAYIPFDMSIFKRSMEICSPDSASECKMDYCEVPRGGISRIPELEMYKTGFKTKPMCIANIRTSKQALQIAQFIAKERYQVDEQVMNIFYTMALIRMLGHKWILEGENDGSGGIVPVANTNPYNCLQGFRYHYMDPLFPQAGNVNNIIAMDLSVLDMFGRSLVSSRNPNFKARGPRGEPIFELWHSEDWYRQEVLDNKEYVDRMKYTMPSSLLPGYTLEPDGSVKEVIGNFVFRVTPGLPKFTESTKGGITVVQPMQKVEVDSGNRPIHNFREFDNAPFLMTVAIGKDVGEILTRPTITTGIDGRPIHPITGNPKEDWRYWNEYDSVCNPEKNMPHFRKTYEMGFRMKNADAGWGFIGRAKKFRLRPTNTCDLRDIFKIAPQEQDCHVVTIGCNPLNDRVSNNIMRDDVSRRVKCSSLLCGDSENLTYTLKIRKENQDSIAPGQNPLGSCECGDTIQVVISDEDGDVVKVRNATILQTYRPNIINPDYTIIVKLDSTLSAGECITSISCPDATPTLGFAIACADSESDGDLPSDQIRVTLDSSLNCGVGADVTIDWLDEDKAALSPAVSETGEIISFDPATNTYVLEVDGETLSCDVDGACYIRVTCNP